jgi:hypothetical protein
VVDLVEDDQRPAGHRAAPVHLGCHAHLGVGQHRAVEVAGRVHVGVAERVVELDPDAGGGVGPLHLQVLGRRHDGHGLDGVVGEEFGRDPQRERRLAGARRGDREEVLVPTAQVLEQCLALPGA